MSERQERFRALYEADRSKIIAYALRRTASSEDAADVVADTFAIAWQRLDDIPAGEAALLWLYVTARNVLANHGRRLMRRSGLQEALAIEFRDGSYLVDPLEEESVVASLVLASLPESDRELLMLAAWEGLSSSELALVIGCSPNSARVRLHRARARLSAEIGEQFGESRPPRTIRPVVNTSAAASSPREVCGE